MLHMDRQRLRQIEPCLLRNSAIRVNDPTRCAVIRGKAQTAVRVGRSGHFPREVSIPMTCDRGVGISVQLPRRVSVLRRDYGIREGADAVVRARHAIAGLQQDRRVARRADAGRRARRDDVAGA